MKKWLMIGLAVVVYCVLATLKMNSSQEPKAKSVDVVKAKLQGVRPTQRDDETMVKSRQDLIHIRSSQAPTAISTISTSSLGADRRDPSMVETRQNRPRTTPNDDRSLVKYKQELSRKPLTDDISLVKSKPDWLPSTQGADKPLVKSRQEVSRKPLTDDKSLVKSKPDWLPTTLGADTFIGGTRKNMSHIKSSQPPTTVSVIPKLSETKLQSVRTALTGGQSMVETRQDWSPYMDILDEKTALKDSPLTDLKRSVDASLSKVYLLEKKRFYQMGDPVNVRIDLFDFYGKLRQRGGDQLRVRIFEKALNASASGYVLDHKNGSYTAKLKCLWTGTPTIQVYIAYKREAVRAIYHIRKTIPSTRDTYVTYINNDTRRCHAFTKRFSQSATLCNMTSLNGNMSWFCEGPSATRTSCSDVKSFKLKTPYPELPITTAENSIFTRNREKLSPVLNITVKGKPSNPNDIAKKPPCSSVNRTQLWFQASPIGHFMRNEWEPEHCTATPVDRFRQCLRNKHVFLYGDSTVRQWFVNVQRRFGCIGISEKWTQKKWKRNSAAYCESMNLTIEWIVHSFPGNIDPTRVSQNSISDHMLKFAGTKNAIFVIHLMCHLTAYHHDVFRDRMSHIRKSVDTVLRVNKHAQVLIKGSHTFRYLRQVSDYYGYIYRTITIEEFKGLYDKVVYLDNKDITIAREGIPIHPDDIAVTAMINQMLSYICD